MPADDAAPAPRCSRRSPSWPDERGLAVDRSDPRHPRVWIRRRGDTFPTVEHLAVIAPSVMRPKTSPGFRGAWEECETYLPPAPTARQVELAPAS